MAHRSRLALVVVATAIMLCGSASASASAEPTRIARNAQNAVDAIAADGTRLAWQGVAASGADSEIFLADIAQPITQSIGPCPQTNPCQLTNDAADDVLPLRSADFAVWQRKDLIPLDRSIWFSDGTTTTKVPGSARPIYEGAFVSLSGSRLVWRGTDGAAAAGIFLADLSQPLATGATSLCPATNPCRIATGSAPASDDSGPVIDGARVVWSTRPTANDATEIQLFDATRPAEATVLACPLSNPCRLTANDRGDGAPVVSGALIAWPQCDADSCVFVAPDRIVFNDGAENTEVVGDWAGQPLATDGTRIAWTPNLGDVTLLDTSRPIDVAATAFPMACPLGNPCRLDATGAVQMAGGWLLSSDRSDVPGPIALRLFDLRRPLDPQPFSACPGTNPCVLREGVEDQTALSAAAAAWFECPPEAGGCPQPYGGSFDLYAVPEPSGAGAAAIAVLALAWGRRRSSI